MDQLEWGKLVHYSARAFDTIVIRELKPLLTDTLQTTKDLVERMLPVMQCRGPAIDVRYMLFKSLMRLAKDTLANCCERGPVKAYMGREIRPFLWRKPAPPKPVHCRHCGGIDPIA